VAGTPPSGERSVEDLLRQLADEAGTLVREEIALARRELESQVRELGVGAGMVGAAGLLGLLSAGAGTAALVLLLARRPRPWFAAATVSGLYAGAGALLAREGRRRIAAVGVPVPEQTAETLKEGVPWRTTQTPPGSAPT
jgi:Putative Actinobacterial Holin-X, holin superfamily III